jgi:hypothetical protein
MGFGDSEQCDGAEISVGVVGIKDEPPRSASQGKVPARCLLSSRLRLRRYQTKGTSRKRSGLAFPSWRIYDTNCSSSGWTSRPYVAAWGGSSCPEPHNALIWVLGIKQARVETQHPLSFLHGVRIYQNMYFSFRAAHGTEPPPPLLCRDCCCPDAARGLYKRCRLDPGFHRAPQESPASPFE